MNLMPDLSSEAIRHALETAKANGFRKVRLRHGDMSLSATLEASEPSELEDDFESDVAVVASGPVVEDVVARSVGYFREHEQPLEAGRRLAAGEVIGDIVALGIANEVVSPFEGTITEVAVRAGDAVEYGQTLLKVER